MLTKKKSFKTEKGIPNHNHHTDKRQPSCVDSDTENELLEALKKITALYNCTEKYISL